MSHSWTYWWGQIHCGPPYQNFGWAIAHLAHPAAPHASPQIGEIFSPCNFFDCPVFTFLLDPAPRSNRWTDFHVFGSNDVFFRARSVLMGG